MCLQVIREHPQRARGPVELLQRLVGVLHQRGLFACGIAQALQRGFGALQGALGFLQGLAGLGGELALMSAVRLLTLRSVSRNSLPMSPNGTCSRLVMMLDRRPWIWSKSPGADGRRNGSTFTSTVARGALGTKLSDTYIWPVSRLAVLSCARRPSSTRRRRKEGRCRSGGKPLSTGTAAAPLAAPVPVAAWLPCCAPCPEATPASARSDCAVTRAR